MWFLNRAGTSFPVTNRELDIRHSVVIALARQLLLRSISPTPTDNSERSYRASPRTPFQKSNREYRASSINLSGVSFSVLWTLSSHKAPRGLTFRTRDSFKDILCSTSSTSCTLRGWSLCFGDTGPDCCTNGFRIHFVTPDLYSLSLCLVRARSLRTK